MSNTSHDPLAVANREIVNLKMDLAVTSMAYDGALELVAELRQENKGLKTKIDELRMSQAKLTNAMTPQQRDQMWSNHLLKLTENAVRDLQGKMSMMQAGIDELRRQNEILSAKVRVFSAADAALKKRLENTGPEYRKYCSFTSGILNTQGDEQ